jgi:hypothetical protein
VFIHVGNVTVLKYQSLGKGQIYGVVKRKKDEKERGKP